MIGRFIRNSIKVLMLLWALIILGSMFYYSFKLSIEPEREYPELDELTELKGIVKSVECYKDQSVDAIELENGLTFEIIRSPQISCSNALDRWIGKSAKLMAYSIDGETEVYELYVGKRRVFDILWFKSKNRNNETLMILAPYFMVFIWLFFYWRNRRKGGDWLKRPWFK